MNILRCKINLKAYKIGNYVDNCLREKPCHFKHCQMLASLS